MLYALVFALLAGLIGVMLIMARSGGRAAEHQDDLQDALNAATERANVEEGNAGLSDSQLRDKLYNGD